MSTYLTINPCLLEAYFGNTSTEGGGYHLSLNLHYIAFDFYYLVLEDRYESLFPLIPNKYQWPFI